MKKTPQAAPFPMRSRAGMSWSIQADDCADAKATIALVIKEGALEPESIALLKKTGLSALSDLLQS